MKYRRLTKEELEGLSDEFISFLIINGIDATLWQNFKKEGEARFYKIIDLFSDFIFDGIIRKVRFVEYQDAFSVKLFKCDEDIIHLISLDSDKPLESDNNITQVVEQSPEHFSVSRVSKNYFPDRETEIFRMISSGGLVSEGKMYQFFENDKD